MQCICVHLSSEFLAFRKPSLKASTRGICSARASQLVRKGAALSPGTVTMTGTKVAVDNPQDIGGDLSKVDANLAELFRSEKPVQYWEYQQHGLSCLLDGAGHFTAGEFRRSVEHLPQAALSKKTYYEKWAAATANLLLEHNLVSQSELDAALGQPHEPAEVKYILPCMQLISLVISDQITT